MNFKYITMCELFKMPVKVSSFTSMAIALIFISFVGGVIADDPRKSTQKLIAMLGAEKIEPVRNDTPIYKNGFEQGRWKYESLDREIKCMALNIYFESRDQTLHGQIAVGLVTINRVLSSRHPNSICEVVWQKRKNKKGRYVAQFSWTLDGKSDRPLEFESWVSSLRAAETLLAEGSLFNVFDFTRGSTHYHASYVDPFWSKKLTRTITVGDHLFYNPSPVAKQSLNKL